MICLRHLLRSKAVRNLIFKPCFSSHVLCFQLPSNIITMVTVGLVLISKQYSCSFSLSLSFSFSFYFSFSLSLLPSPFRFLSIVERDYRRRNEMVTKKQVRTSICLLYRFLFSFLSFSLLSLSHPVCMCVCSYGIKIKIHLLLHIQKPQQMYIF